MQKTDSGPAAAIDVINIASDVAFAVPPRSIYVGTGGHIKVDGLKRDGTAVTLVFKNFPTGRELPVKCITKVYSSGNGTTAGDLIALW